MSVQPKGREAHTDWKVLEAFEEKALSRVLYTYWTDAPNSCAYAKFRISIVRDKLYGFRSNRFKAVSIDRIFLHATHLSFQHPVTEEPLVFSQPMPKDFIDLIEALKGSDSVRVKTNSA